MKRVSVREPVTPAEAAVLIEALIEADTALMAAAEELRLAELGVRLAEVDWNAANTRRELTKQSEAKR